MGNHTRESNLLKDINTHRWGQIEMTERWIDEWMDGWVNGWMNGWMNGGRLVH